MKRQKPLFLGISALFLASASPAMALTAQELWTEWQSQMASMGQIITTQEVTIGEGVLTINGYASRFDEDDLSLVSRLDQVVMTETDDDRVVITMSDNLSVEARFVPEPSMAPVTALVSVMVPGLSITTSGTVDARVYDYAAPRIMITNGPITGGDGALPVIDMAIGIEDFAAIYQLDGSNPTNIGYSSTSSTSGIAGAVSVTPPPGEVGHLKMSFDLGASTSTGTGSFGDMAAATANPDAFPEGMAFAGDFAYDAARLEMTFEHPSDAFTLLSSNQGGRLAATLSEAEMAYRMAATGSSLYFVGPDLPVPVDLKMASAEIGFSVPLAQAAVPQPVSARLAYQDVIINPEIWGMIDPIQAIPRDPISVIADVSGSVRVLTNLFSTDPTEMAAMPGELVDLTLNELRLAIAGAELTGQGSAEFAPGPIPMPVGAVDLQLRGANALIDRLQAAGMVPVEQLAMARGFIAALTRPGAAPDTVESTIQFTQGGGITANGVPLR